jgi:hypothetical protein
VSTVRLAIINLFPRGFSLLNLPSYPKLKSAYILFLSYIEADAKLNRVCEGKCPTFNLEPEASRSAIAEAACERRKVLGIVKETLEEWIVTESVA